MQSPVTPLPPPPPPPTPGVTYLSLLLELSNPLTQVFNLHHPSCRWGQTVCISHKLRGDAEFKFVETLCEEQSDREIYVRKDIRFVFEQRVLELNFLPVPPC